MFNGFVLVLLEQARDMQPTQTVPQQAVLNEPHGKHEAACSATAFEPICVWDAGAISAKCPQKHRSIAASPGCWRHIMTGACAKAERPWMLLHTAPTSLPLHLAAVCRCRHARNLRWRCRRGSTIMQTDGETAKTDRVLHCWSGSVSAARILLWRRLALACSTLAWSFCKSCRGTGRSLSLCEKWVLESGTNRQSSYILYPTTQSLHQLRPALPHSVI